MSCTYLHSLSAYKLYSICSCTLCKRTIALHLYTDNQTISRLFLYMQRKIFTNFYIYAFIIRFNPYICTRSCTLTQSATNH